MQHSIPDFTSETQPVACRESRADCVALNVVRKSFWSQKMHVALQVTLASVHSVLLVRVVHTGTGSVTSVL